jgi:hypothetical protein
VAAAGSGAALALDAGTYAVSVLAVALLRTSSRPAAPKGSMLADLREGWSEFRARTWMWVTTLQFSLFNLANHRQLNRARHTGSAPRSPVRTSLTPRSCRPVRGTGRSDALNRTGTSPEVCWCSPGRTARLEPPLATRARRSRSSCHCLVRGHVCPLLRAAGVVRRTCHSCSAARVLRVGPRLTT